MINAYTQALSTFDYFIFGAGGIIVLFHLRFIFANYHKKSWAVQDGKFWCDLLASVCELLPILGLLGTVGGILNTFSALEGMQENTFEIGMLLGKFAPALTTTVTGMLCLLVNLFFNFWCIWLCHRGDE